MNNLCTSSLHVAADRPIKFRKLPSIPSLVTSGGELLQPTAKDCASTGTCSGSDADLADKRLEDIYEDPEVTTR